MYAGLQYTNANRPGAPNGGYNAFFAGPIGAIRGHFGTLPCGGEYKIEMSLQVNFKNPNTPFNTFVLSDTYYGGSKSVEITLLSDVLKKNFDGAGKNWVIGRCTCLAQRGNGTPTDGTWFGFAPNAQRNGPNLAAPQFGYSGFLAQGPTHRLNDVSTRKAFADRNPPDENTTVLCGRDPYYSDHTDPWSFETYEGFNLGNPAAVGIFRARPCVDL